MPLPQTTKNQKTSEAQVRALLRLLRPVYPTIKEQPGSGNTSWSPNDLHIPRVAQIECKATATASIRIELNWLERARELCSRNGLRTLLAIRIKQSDYFVVEDDVMVHLLKCELELEELRGRVVE